MITPFISSRFFLPLENLCFILRDANNVKFLISSTMVKDGVSNLEEGIVIKP